MDNLKTVLEKLLLNQPHKDIVLKCNVLIIKQVEESLMCFIKDLYNQPHIKMNITIEIDNTLNGFNIIKNEQV